MQEAVNIVYIANKKSKNGLRNIIINRTKYILYFLFKFYNSLTTTIIKYIYIYHCYELESQLILFINPQNFFTQ